MRRALRIALFVIAIATAVGRAQPPEDAPSDSPQRLSHRSNSNSAAVDAIVGRMMAFDKNKDGKLTKDEITDPRLLRLFDRADANHDGAVTKEELTALPKQMIAEAESGAARGGHRGPDGPGGGFGPGPQGGFMGGPPQPGLVISPRSIEMLSLSIEQKAKIDALQKEVDAKLAKILTDEQNSQLNVMKNHGGDPPRPPGL